MFKKNASYFCFRISISLAILSDFSFKFVTFLGIMRENRSGRFFWTHCRAVGVIVAQFTDGFERFWRVFKTVFKLRSYNANSSTLCSEMKSLLLSLFADCNTLRRRLAKWWSHRKAVSDCFPVASSFSKTAPRTHHTIDARVHCRQILSWLHQ